MTTTPVQPGGDAYERKYPIKEEPPAKIVVQEKRIPFNLIDDLRCRVIVFLELPEILYYAGVCKSASAFMRTEKFYRQLTILRAPNLFIEMRDLAELGVEINWKGALMRAVAEKRVKVLKTRLEVVSAKQDGITQQSRGLALGAAVYAQTATFGLAAFCTVS